MQHNIVSSSCCSSLTNVLTQDEHILARKYADRWMAKSLGVGLFRRRLYRKEREDTREVLYSTINPLARVSPAVLSLPLQSWLVLTHAPNPVTECTDVTGAKLLAVTLASVSMNAYHHHDK